MRITPACNPGVICRLETQIGNKLDWKHKKRLETFVLDWKQKKDIGNNLFRLETKSLDWKHKNQIGNKISTLETIFLN